MSNNNESSSNNTPLGVALGVSVALGAAALYTFHLRSSRSSLPVTSRDLEGITVCLTGGNIGIGRAVAQRLGQRGATVLIGCRNIDQGQQVCEEIGGNQCSVFPLDLANPMSVEAFSKNIVNQTTRSGLHLLINNAGAMLKDDQKLTPDNYDASMAVNHLGWMQLTYNLLPILEKTRDKTKKESVIRIVNVGSKLEKSAKLPEQYSDQDWDEWMSTPPTPYTPFQAYAKAKLAMSAVTMEWANDRTTTIPMVLISPGMVNTNLPRFLPLWKRALSWPLRATLLRTPQQAADTVLFAATSSDAQNGFYYNAQCQPIHNDPIQCSESSRDPQIRQQLWQASLRALEKRKTQA